MNSELNTFKKDTRKRVQDNIIRLRDTRGNFYLAIRMPTKDYEPREEEKETKSNIQVLKNA